MPHRAPTRNKRPKYGAKYSVSLVKPVSVKEIKMEEKLKKDVELVIPNTIAGKIPNKRYSEVRLMKGMTMGDWAALCLLTERGEFPAQLLYTGHRKQLLDKKYKKARMKAKKELQLKWLGMRQERLEQLDKAKEVVSEKIKKGEIKVPKTLQPKKRKTVKGVKKSKETPPEKPILKKATLTPPQLKTPAIEPPKSSYTDGTMPELNPPQDRQ